MSIPELEARAAELYEMEYKSNQERKKLVRVLRLKYAQRNAEEAVAEASQALEKVEAEVKAKLEPVPEPEPEPEPEPKWYEVLKERLGL